MAGRSARFAALAALLIAAASSGASAAEWRNDELRATLVSSFTVSTSMRVQDRDCKQIATVNGGCNTDTSLGTQGRLLNSDNGNLNYGKGQFFSVLAQATHDVQVDYKDVGAFVRFTYFADALQAQESNTDRTDLRSEERFRASLLQGGVVGAHFYFLDAYAFASFELADRFWDFRVGNQVLNWGESFFTQGGINTISTLDVTKIRLAGSEIRDALLPAPIARMSTTLWEGLSIELFYQMLWRKALLDPVNTFFSGNDLVARGARAQFVPPPFGCGDEGTDPNAPGLPPSCTTGDLSRTFPFAFPLRSREDANDQGQWGAALRYYIDSIETELAAYYVRFHDKYPTVSYRGSALNLALCQDPATGGAPKFGCDAGYVVEFKNNIDLVGFSFNTVIADLAFGGEFSWRHDQPVPRNTGADIQQFTIDLIVAGADPATATLRKVNGASREDRVVGILNMLYVFGPGNTGGGWLVRALGASDAVLIAETGFVWYPKLSDGRGDYAGPLKVDRIDRAGGGYQLRLTANYERFLGSPLRVSPTVAFRHDVLGITPSGEAAYNEDVMQVGLSLEVNYLQRWKGVVSYSNSWGGGQRNGTNDRDFVGLSISYAL